MSRLRLAQCCGRLRFAPTPATLRFAILAILPPPTQPTSGAGTASPHRRTRPAPRSRARPPIRRPRNVAVSHGEGLSTSWAVAAVVESSELMGSCSLTTAQSHESTELNRDKKDCRWLGHNGGFWSGRHRAIDRERMTCVDVHPHSELERSSDIASRWRIQARPLHPSCVGNRSGRLEPIHRSTRSPDRKH